MIRKIGTRLVSFANVGVPAALGLALTMGAAHAFTAPAAGDLGYDIYDIVVNKGVKGPLGFVAGVAAFFVDTDGKKGLSGKVVTRAGAALARTFIAGTIAGISQTVEGTFGSTATSALGNVRTLDPGDAAKSGVAGGLGRSSDKLAEFYLDLARQAGPIVEVGAAKDVVVVIQEGVTLEIKASAGVKF